MAEDCQGIELNGQCLEMVSKFFYLGDIRGGSRTAATSKMEHFVSKCSILDVVAVLDPPLDIVKASGSTVNSVKTRIKIGWSKSRDFSSFIR